MAKHLLLLVLLASILHTATAASPVTTLANSTTPTVYETLAHYNFPRGILPEGVQGYVLRPDGSFEVYLPGECDFIVLKQYKMRFGSSIGGNIQDQSIRELWGVRLQVLFAWVGINRVDHVGDELRFEAGKFVQSFPVGNFAVSPRCGSGTVSPSSRPLDP